MKIYKYLNILLLVIFIIGTIFSYENLPYEIELFMQSPSRDVFAGINFVILLTPFRSRIGFKLPWILKDKLCWQKTHRFAGYTAIPLGIIQCLLVLFFPDNNMIFMFGTGFWIILVCVYSLFARSANQKN